MAQLTLGWTATVTVTVGFLIACLRLLIACLVFLIACVVFSEGVAGSLRSQVRD